MIDIHNHILPAVDDGSESMDETIEMINLYIENGFKGVISTSHYRKPYYVEKRTVLEKIEEIEEELVKRGIEFKIYPGNEIFLEMDIVDLLSEDKISTMANSKYILLELPFFSKANYLEDVIYKLQLKGYIVILAHCERYKYVQEDITYLLPFIKSGVLIQVNISSFNKDVSDQIYVTTDRLMRHKMVHFLATDTHDLLHRSPNVKSSLYKLKDKYGKDYLSIILGLNQEKILRNEFISVDYDEIKGTFKKKEKKKKGIFSRLKEKFGG